MALIRSVNSLEPMTHHTSALKRWAGAHIIITSNQTGCDRIVFPPAWNADITRQFIRLFLPKWLQQQTHTHILELVRMLAHTVADVCNWDQVIARFNSQAMPPCFVCVCICVYRRYTNCLLWYRGGHTHALEITKYTHDELCVELSVLKPHIV